MSKEFTLEELANSAMPVEQPAVHQQKAIIKESPNGGAKPMTASQVADNLIAAGKMQKKVETVVDAPLVETAFKSMNATLEERRSRIEQAIPYIHENAREMALENELNDLDAADEPQEIEDDYEDSELKIEQDESVESTYTTVETNMDAYNFNGKIDNTSDNKPLDVEPANQSDNFTDNDYFAKGSDLDDLASELNAESEEDEFNVEDTEEEDPEEARERFRKTLQNVQIISNPIDLNKFHIRRDAVSSNAVLNTIQNSRTIKTADWALYHTGRSFTFMECSGPELDSLRKTIENSNNLNAVIKSLQFIYNHIQDANKPSFEAWCKIIRTEDIESLYYGLYRACYAHSNLIGRVCESDTCKKTSLINTNIDDMVVYGGENDNHEEIKANFKKILSGDTTTESISIKSELLQISDNIVISYSPATLYSTFVQFSAIKPEITQKYTDLLNSLAYIDGFFSINRQTNELTPISIKEYPRNLNKTVLNRLSVYTSILKTLTNDQYNVLMATLANVIQSPKIKYVFPKDKCPECGHEMSESDVDSMLNLLFTRAQLAQIRSL